MDNFFASVPMFLPSWFIALLALIAAFECIGLSLYLIRTHDHLIMRAADVGIIGCFCAIVGIYYAMVWLQPGNYTRSIAIFRISWALFFAADVVIMTRYIVAILRTRGKPS